MIAAEASSTGSKASKGLTRAIMVSLSLLRGAELTFLAMKLKSFSMAKQPLSLKEGLQAQAQPEA